MSKLKADFLACKTYETFDARRDEFRRLDPSDPEVQAHLLSLLPQDTLRDQYPPEILADPRIVRIKERV